MGHVLGRVALLGRRKRTPRPVAALEVLGELHAEFGFQDGLEAELGAPGESRSDLSVEDGRELELEVALEQHDVVVGAVEDLFDLRIGHHGREAREVGQRERVDERRASFGVGELDQADFLEVMEETVRLGVDGERGGAGDRADVFAQLPGRSNPKGRRSDGVRE